MSEQQFSASLEDQGPRPRFVLDRNADGAGAQPQASAQPPSFDEGSTSSHGAGDHPTGDPRSADDGQAEANRTTLADSEPESARTPNLASDWREQVSAKVNSYRSRRPRKERFPSLQLQFHPTPYPARERSCEAAGFEPQPPEQAIAPASPEAAAEPPLLLEATARVIEFPRPMPAPVAGDELAEPVVDRPRILDVPESLPAPPAMGGILIEPRDEPEPERRPGFDIPLQSARLGRRVFAAAVDGLLVAVAVALFAYVSLRWVSVVPPIGADLEVIAALLAFLWPAYQYSLLVYCGTTPGLRLAGLTLEHFDGGPVPRKLRQWRVLASLLSALSLGLGYAWCLLDEDQLSWHDRITRTHLAEDMANPAENQ